MNTACFREGKKLITYASVRLFRIQDSGFGYLRTADASLTEQEHFYCQTCLKKHEGSHYWLKE